MIFLKLAGCVEVMASKAEAEMDQDTNSAASDEDLNMSEEEEEEEEDGLEQKEVDDANQEKSDEEKGDGGGERVDDASEDEKTKDKKCVPGIVYLGHIPPRVRPKHVRNMLAVHGEIGRVFLQSEGK